MTKNFPLRITDKNLYPLLEKEARSNRWSVNTLINSILESHAKNNKKKVGKNIVISK